MKRLSIRFITYFCTLNFGLNIGVQLRFLVQIMDYKQNVYV